MHSHLCWDRVTTYMPKREIETSSKINGVDEESENTKDRVQHMNG